MKSISGASPCRWSARIRSAAKMKLPFSTATMMRLSSLAAAISCASSSTLRAIASAVMSGLMAGAAAIPAMTLVGLGETNLDAPDIAWRRGNLAQERRVLAGGKFGLAHLCRPLGNLRAALVPERDHHGRNVHRRPRRVYHVALHFEHGLTAIAGPAVADALEG